MPDSTGHRFAYSLPKGLPLALRRMPDERSQMPIGRRSGYRAWHDHDRITAKIGENGDSILGAFKVFRERCLVHTARQSRAIE
jgi:hypothetical protein